MTVTLTSGPDSFTAQSDRIEQVEWDSLLEHFDDADLCQTWAYGRARWGSGRLRHLIVRQGDQVVAAAQIARIGPPLPRIGMAYVKWGPLWRRVGAEPDAAALDQMVRALHQHYVQREGLVLRIMPRGYAGFDDQVAAQLTALGLTPATSSPVYRTIRLDLRSSLDELHSSLKKSWRARLRKAQAQNLRVRIDHQDQDFQVFKQLYDEMLRHKTFDEASELPIYGEIQQSLPDVFKLRVVTCWQADRPLSAHICAALGDTAVSLCGATSRAGRETGSSYLMDWATITWLKEKGYHWYDLGGAGDPLVTQYKLGLAGRRAEVITAIGRFDIGPAALRQAVQFAETARNLGRRIRARASARS